jgi:hypothetical protein
MIAMTQYDVIDLAQGSPPRIEYRKHGEGSLRLLWCGARILGASILRMLQEAGALVCEPCPTFAWMFRERFWRLKTSGELLRDPPLSKEAKFREAVT